jgi:hypothetical protein
MEHFLDIVVLWELSAIQVYYFVYDLYVHLLALRLHGSIYRRGGTSGVACRPHLRKLTAGPQIEVEGVMIGLG